MRVEVKSKAKQEEYLLVLGAILFFLDDARRKGSADIGERHAEQERYGDCGGLYARRFSKRDKYMKK
jgi:hypothetical protein